MNSRRIRVLSYTTLYPSPANPLRGLFVARRLAYVAREADITVVAPVALRFGESAAPGEIIPGSGTVRTLHPWYWLPPGMGRRWHDRLLYAETRSAIGSLKPETFDLVDAQYAYPDGSAARMIAKRIGKPYVLTVRGSDLHVLAKDASRRSAIQETVRSAGAVIAVSRPLARLAETLGADPGRVHWIPNGVDREQFRPRSRSEARSLLGWDPARPSILFVGRLDPVKGIGLLLDSLAGLRRIAPEPVVCRIAGDGPMRREIRRTIEARGLQEQIVLMGAVRPETLALCYAASDLLCLPSVSEGSPNVVLESLASGTPVVSADVGDVADLIDDCGGVVVRNRNPEDFARAAVAVLSKTWDREAIAALVSERGWDRVASAQMEVYRSVLEAA